MSQPNYDQELIIKLQDDEFADTYFLNILQQCNDMNKEDAQKELTATLKLITQARGGMGKSLEKIGMAESFYKLLSSALLKIWR